jgi:hypothetical protein
LRKEAIEQAVAALRRFKSSTFLPNVGSSFQSCVPLIFLAALCGFARDTLLRDLRALLRNTVWRGLGQLKNLSITSFQHGALESRFTWTFPDASLRAWMPAIHAGMTVISKESGLSAGQSVVGVAI